MSWWDQIAIDAAAARFDRASLTVRSLEMQNAYGQTETQAREWRKEWEKARREMFDAYMALCQAKGSP